MRPLSTERGEVKPARPRELRKSCLPPRLPFLETFFLLGSCSFFDSGPLQLLYLL